MFQIIRGRTVNSRIPVTATFAKRVVEMRFEDLSERVLQVCREVMLDGAANMLAGSREPLSPKIVRYVRGLGGPEAASVIGHGFKTHVIHAAFANGTFCHAMDYEMMWSPPTHPTGPVLPVVLALAEERDLPGRDAALALALGFEIQGRMRASVVASGADDAIGIHPPGSVGPLGAAGAAGKLLGLDERMLRNAFGIAGSRISGLLANHGNMTKATHCGHAARMGLESALLAQDGFTGAEDIIEGHRGYSETFYRNALDVSLMVESFGSPFRMVDPGLAVKRFPCQIYTHWSIDAALNVRNENNLNPDDIEEVTIEVGSDNPSIRDRRPATGLEGKFNLAYTVALALLDGRMEIDSFSQERYGASDIFPMMARLRIIQNPAIHAKDLNSAWSRVTARTKTGKQFTSRVDRPLGMWDNPLSWDDRVAKFDNCAARVLTRKEAHDVVRLIEQFDRLSHLRDLLALLRGR
jgi:aconitate decarboxylase